MRPEIDFELDVYLNGNPFNLTFLIYLDLVRLYGNCTVSVHRACMDYIVYPKAGSSFILNTTVVMWFRTQVPDH